MNLEEKSSKISEIYKKRDRIETELKQLENEIRNTNEIVDSLGDDECKDKDEFLWLIQGLQKKHDQKELELKQLIEEEIIPLGNEIKKDIDKREKTNATLDSASSHNHGENAQNAISEIEKKKIADEKFRQQLEAMMPHDEDGADDGHGPRGPMGPKILK